MVHFLLRFVPISGGGVKNLWKIGGNLPIGGKEYTLDESKITAFHLFGTYDTDVNFSVKTWMSI